MDYIDRYNRRTQRSGRTLKEKAISEIRRNFKKHLQESPSAFEVQATVPNEVNISPTTRKIWCMINNITLNDQRVLDEKYLHVDIDEDIDIGCYVLWQNSHWLIMFREHNTMGSHKTFTMRRCNQIMKHRWKGQVWEIPVSIENLTMYSDGLADLKMTSQPDSKRHLSFGSNPVTKEINFGTRLMVGKKSIFRVTHINDFEYNSAYSGADGLIKALVLYTSTIAKDDIENGIAWNDEEVTSEDTQTGIKGEVRASLGSSEKYFVENESVTYEIIEDGNYKYVSMDVVSDKECRLKITSDSRFIGKKIILNAYRNIDNTLLDSIEIKIVGM